MNEKILTEEESLQLALYPLCTVTHQSVCDDFTEETLHKTMSINDIILAKLEYGIIPRLKECQFCTLSNDLPRVVVDHINANKHDNRLCNLRRVTQQTNILSARDLGRKTRSLTRSQVENLGHEYDLNPNIQSISEKYGISPHAVLDILRNKTYKDINRYLPMLPKYSRWNKISK